MANKRIKDLPVVPAPTTGDVVPIDGATTRSVTVEDFLGDNLIAIKGVTSGADKLAYFNGAGTADVTDLTAQGRALLDDADAAAQRATIGLNNVDNTSDLNKPISTATQSALDLKADKTTTLSAGTGLTGGGDLSADRTIALDAASQASLAKADTAVQPGDTLNITTPTGTVTRAINTWSEGPSSGTVPGDIRFNQMYGSLNAPMSGTDIPNGDGSKSWSVLGIFASVGPNYDGVEAQAISGGIATTGPTLTTSDFVGINMGVLQSYTGLARIYGACFAATVGESGSAPIMLALELGTDLQNPNPGDVPYRLGVNIINYGLHRAGVVDTAISVMGGNPGGQYNNVLTLVQADSAAQSIQPTGSIIAAESAKGEQTIGSVINLPNVTITNDVINTKHALLTAQGLLALGSATEAGTLVLQGGAVDVLTINHSYDGEVKWHYGGGSAMFFFKAVGSLTGENSIEVDHLSSLVRLPCGLLHTGPLGFYGSAPVAKQTGVPVTADGIHAALVNLGLISA